MPTIDNLDIQIKASANSATQALDKLVEKLDILSSSLSKINGSGLTGLANGVSKLSTAMQSINGIDSRKFSTLADNINKLSAINTAGLNASASAMSQITRALNNLGTMSSSAQQVTQLSSALGSLGKKNVSNAITNIPQLATAMKGLMQTLSTAPRVSSNLIQMTNALANLASQGSKVGTATRSINNGLNSFSASANRASKSSRSLASAFGRLYANYFWITRIGRYLRDATTASMDYLETLNYFNVAFEQVADKADLSAFEELGYESADAYYKSFAERAKQVTAQMSGFNVNDNGTLTATGGVSLGIDPDTLMNYQAAFGQISSSMGVASETSLMLSEALTKLGADLASVKNMDFEETWTNLQSGLVGMSRSVDKFGINIRNVNLQQKLLDLGIDANIQNLNQQDKALLRGIVILESTQYAWGDLSKTLNAPANQLRLLQANWQNLSRTIGNLFLPLVAKVLPLINGLVIALQRLFTWLGMIMGIDLSGLVPSQGGLGDVAGDIEDIDTGLGNASKSAKELKKQLRGFDELNVVTSPKTDDSGTGAGIGGVGSGLLDQAFMDAYSKYLEEWDKAYAQIENKANDIADKIQDIATSPAFQMLASGLLAFLGTLAVFKIGQWAYNAFLFISTKWNDFLANPNVTLALQVAGVAAATTALKLVSDEVANAAGSYDTLLEASKESYGDVGGTLYANLVATFGGEDSILNKPMLWIEQLFNAEMWADVWDNWSTGMVVIEDGWNEFWDGIFSSINEWWNESVAPWFTKEKWEGLFDEMGNSIKNVWNDIVIWWNNTAIVKWWNNNVAPWFTKKKWEDLFNNIKKSFEDKWNAAFTWFGNTWLGKFFAKISSRFSPSAVSDWFKNIPTALKAAWDGAVEGVKQIWNNFANWLNSKLTWTVPALEIPGIGKLTESFTIDLGKIPTFAYGGYPDMGSLFIANEAGPELVGTMNGRSAVASNMEITGIRDAIYKSSQQEMALMRQEIQLLQGILAKEFGISRSDIYNSVRQSDQDYRKMTGKSGFALT